MLLISRDRVVAIHAHINISLEKHKQDAVCIAAVLDQFGFSTPVES